VWDDLRVPVNAIRVGPVRPADFSVFRDGLLSLAFSTTFEQQVYFAVQMSHRWDQSTPIRPHVHWSVTSTNIGTVAWNLEYSWANINDAFPASITISAVSSATGLAFKQNIGSFLVGSAFIHEFDIHFQINTMGSRETFTK
jgi:hypothetical protein